MSTAWGRPERRIHGMVLALVIALGGMVGAACGEQAAGGAGDAATAAPYPRTQTIDGGNVTVAVTWGGPEVGPVFEVAMDTHSVDLDGYDLTSLAVLRTSQGVEIAARAWDSPAGGHHRSGTLTFPATSPDGKPIGGTFDLVIRDIAGVPERVFRWMP